MVIMSYTGGRIIMSGEGEVVVKMTLSVTDYGYNVIHRRQNDHDWCPLLTMVIMSYTGGGMIMSGVRY